jgi:hypothetical protein
MKRHTFLTTFVLALGLIFLVSVLTVESHANENGNLGHKCPTVIESTIELAVTEGYEDAREVFVAVDYLPVPLQIFFVSKSTVSPHVYRGPPATAAL